MAIRIFWIALYAFIFILPVPGTIALRHVLLLVLLVTLVWATYGLRRSSPPPVSTEMRQFLLLLVALTFWLFAQAFWISEETSWAMKEISGQWLPALLAAIVGLGTGHFVRQSVLARKALLSRLILAMMVQLVFSLLATLPEFLQLGAFPQGKTLLTAGKLEISYWNNMLLALLAVDGFSRWLHQRPLSTLPRSFLWTGILLVFVSNLAFGARNGIIGSLALLFSLTGLVFWKECKQLSAPKAGSFVAGMLMLIGLVAWSNYHFDVRWKSFEQTAAVAWHIENNTVWLHPDAPPPLLASGQPVEMSAFLRISWIHAGLKLIAERPLGVGYGRNAFGHSLRKTIGTRLGHSHSGLIDWTVGVGIPGLILWTAFCGWLFWIGARRYVVFRDPIGLVLVFLVGGFFGRMLLDSVNRDHMLVLFFLIVALVLSQPDDSLPQYQERK